MSKGSLLSWEYLQAEPNLHTPFAKYLKSKYIIGEVFLGKCSLKFLPIIGLTLMFEHNYHNSSLNQGSATFLIKEPSASSSSM